MFQRRPSNSSADGLILPGRLPSSSRARRRSFFASSSNQRVCALLLVGFCVASFSDGRHTTFLRLPEVDTLQFSSDTRLPLLMAAVYFTCLSLLSFVAINVLHYMRSLIDRWTAQIKWGLQAHFFISTLAASFYFSAYTFDTHLLQKMPDGGQHMIMRSFHWTVSTPIQWYIFRVSFGARQEGLGIIYCATVLCQIFGMLMLVFTGEVGIWLSGIASFAAFIVMFHFVYKMPLRPETRKAARLCQGVAVCIWSSFPVVTLARQQQWISPWWEQIICYTLLDCSAKGITFGGAIASRLLLTLASIDGTIQLVMATNDFCVVVDSNFYLIDSVWDSPVVSQYFDSATPDKSLLCRCLNQEHVDRLSSAADKADSQHFAAPSPKCVVAFRLHGGMGNVLAECHVTKCVQGRRVIGVAVVSVSGHGLPSDMSQDDLTIADGDLDDDGQMSRTTYSRVPDGQSEEQMQWMLALHNCTNATQISPEISIMLRWIFMEPQIAAALYYVADRDPSSEYESSIVVVAASSQLVRDLPGLTVPRSFTTLVDSKISSTIANSTKFHDLCLYKSASTRLCTGAMATIFAMPFSRVSPSSGQSDIQFGMLLFEIEGNDGTDVAEEPAPKVLGTDHCFWYYVAGRLLCMECSLDNVITPPVAVSMPPEVAGGFPFWNVVFSIPLSSAVAEGEEARVPSAVLATPCTDGVQEQEDDQSLTFSAEEARRALDSAARPSSAHERAPPVVLAPFLLLPSLQKRDHGGWLNSAASNDDGSEMGR